MYRSLRSKQDEEVVQVWNGLKNGHQEAIAIEQIKVLEQAQVDYYLLATNVLLIAVSYSTSLSLKHHILEYLSIDKSQYLCLIETLLFSTIDKLSEYEMLLFYRKYEDVLLVSFMRNILTGTEKNWH